MKKRTFLCIVLACCTISFYGQQKPSVEKKAPKSIYTFRSDAEDTHSFPSLNKRLTLASLEMQWTSSSFHSDLNPRPVEFKKMSTKPITFHLDDMQRYQNSKFIREFFYKNDPTRWNLQCVQNRIQPGRFQQ
ncbi:hypothetical protein [Polaribacter sp. HL-MS24]|uniref:hypothetical protein n=1 Tax=Polaribacter sp. HL-MS24 TaxID=3077735 RepID=UPI0029345125|nr:hypothetical protein [Polaribacter sp. HL-MS24]WOC39461.1 hypothetical protein RRF69_07170 [Polaribacter sp. HL-MS24]